MGSASKRVKRRYTKLERTSRSSSRNDHPLEVLHHTTSKQTVRRDAGPSRSWRKRMAFGQPLPDESHEFRVIEQCVDWIEKVVLEEDGLSSQRHVEQGRLPAGRSNH